MQFTVRFTFLYTGLALLLIPPTTSQEQCTLPTDQDVTEVANTIFEAIKTKGTAAQTVQEVFQVNFTCLAKVAQDMYAYATVVTNFTTTNSSSDSQVEQFHLRCGGGAWVVSPSSAFKNPANIPAMPFATETQFQCSNCEELPSANPESNCICEFAHVEE